MHFSKLKYVSNMYCINDCQKTLLQGRICLLTFHENMCGCDANYNKESAKNLTKNFN
jgi:hypothetical protein